MKKVYVAMCADGLHAGHRNIIKEAAKLGDVTVGLLTDSAICGYKPAPRFSFTYRAIHVQGAAGVSSVMPQATLDYELNLRALKPDYVVHGDDWKIGVQAETRAKVIDTLKEWGGVLVEPPYTKGISSTMLRYSTIKLDVGCSKYKQSGYVGIDIRELDGVDIVHDICKFPWPLSDSCCTAIRMHLVWACIEPKYRIMVMDELWRIAKPDCVLDVRETHTNAPAAIHDPIYYSAANEWTFLYFDPRHNKYKVYEPKPWYIIEYMYDNRSVIEITMRPVK